MITLKIIKSSGSLKTFCAKYYILCVIRFEVQKKKLSKRSLSQKFPSKSHNVVCTSKCWICWYWTSCDGFSISYSRFLIEKKTWKTFFFSSIYVQQDSIKRRIISFCEPVLRIMYQFDDIETEFYSKKISFKLKCEMNFFKEKNSFLKDALGDLT